MVDLTHVHGKRLAMIAWGRKDDGSDDVAVFTGVASWDGQPSDNAPLLGAEYCLSVGVGDLQEGDNLYEKTGLQWP
jgi:hypothetical protein